MRKSELVCTGRCDGLGNDDREGSYVRLVRTTPNEVTGIVISEGAAEVLAAELLGAVTQKNDAILERILRNTRGA